MALRRNSTKQQECIPVGCVPSAAVAVSGGGVYLVPGGCTWSGGCTLSGGVPGPGGCTWSGGVYLVQEVYLVPGDVPHPRGVYLVRGDLVPGGVPGQVLPPCRQTDACKNITFATSLRTVINTTHHHTDVDMFRTMSCKMSKFIALSAG